VLDLAGPAEFENLGEGRKVISQIGGSLAAGILSPPSTSADLIHGTAPDSGGLAGDNRCCVTGRRNIDIMNFSLPSHANCPFASTEKGN
jgi:hypothetical protein